jgi:hypothetical protein
MRAKTGVAIAALVVSAGLAGCTNIKIAADYDPNASFEGLDSYAWLPRPQPKTGDARLDSTLVDQRVRRAVDSALAAKGIRLATERPRFLVAYNLALDKKIRVDTIHHGYGHGRYGWHGAYVATDTRVREYEVGSIILDILEPRSRNLLWRGTASAKVTESASPEQREKRINQAVSRMLERFPPRPAG